MHRSMPFRRVNNKYYYSPEHACCVCSHTHTHTHTALCPMSISGSRSIQTHSKGLIINITLLLLLSARWNTVNYTSNTNYYQITTITMKKKLRNKYKMDLNTLVFIY